MSAWKAVIYGSFFFFMEAHTHTDKMGSKWQCLDGRIQEYFHLEHSPF